ncbi:unnamed protein product [Clonostachys byssicola]|uniref:Uncharacterized protein n=1 Tax=Clonostachys byssicola TaxID=160290 RepID=A0A9N9U482_9HYPO|nr:unnamed protein product [Clonostachys byssicola]
MDGELVDEEYLGIGNPHYIIAQNFSEEAQEWLTHYNFAISAIVDDPKYPKGSVVVPGDVWAWSPDSLLKRGPFRGRIPLSVNDKQPASNKPTSYAITKLNGYFETSSMRAEEVIMPDSWISSEDAKPFARELLKHPQTARFFDGLNYSAWRKVYDIGSKGTEIGMTEALKLITLNGQYMKDGFFIEESGLHTESTRLLWTEVGKFGSICMWTTNVRLSASMVRS